MPAHREEFRTIESAAGTWPDFENDNTREKERAASYGHWRLGIALRFCSGEKSWEYDGFWMKGSFMVVVVQFAGLIEGTIKKGRRQEPQFLLEYERM